jgi:hypothetical protein
MNNYYTGVFETVERVVKQHFYNQSEAQLNLIMVYSDCFFVKAINT